MKKTCFKCGKTKAVGDFYPHRDMADGYLGKCKECAKSDVKNHRAKNPNKYREYDRFRSSMEHRVSARRKYSETERGREVSKKAKHDWDKRNTEKKYSYVLVARALRAGALQRRSCESCGAKAEAHHDDYSKPLSVRWLCDFHHKEWHKKDRERKRIKT
jgi:hypothetical protein